MPYDESKYDIEQAPNDIEKELDNLKKYLDDSLPKKVDGKNLLLATWNIRCFGDLTEKWETGKNDSPKRNIHAIHAIKEIISRFDVIAVQEVKNNIKALRRTIKLLGDEWGFLMTDVTAGDPGNGERLAFIFNTERVKPSGLACELVVPEVLRSKNVARANAFQQQFARTPYAVSFNSSGKTFIIVTLHVDYGFKNKPNLRIPELIAIANWMKDWAKDSKAFGQNILVMGDFNTDQQNDERYNALISTGLHIPHEIASIPKTIFAKKQTENHYDQIAWFNETSTLPYLSFEYKKGGCIDFRKTVYIGMENLSISWRMSDHFPLWAEFELK